MIDCHLGLASGPLKIINSASVKCAKKSLCEYQSLEQRSLPLIFGGVRVEISYNRVLRYAASSTVRVSGVAIRGRWGLEDDQK